MQNKSQNYFRTCLKYPQKIEITAATAGIHKGLYLSMNKEHIISLLILIKT
jgi:hypothetical protein